jgi:hypothetical protein
VTNVIDEGQKTMSSNAGYGVSHFFNTVKKSSIPVVSQGFESKCFCPVLSLELVLKKEILE